MAARPWPRWRWHGSSAGQPSAPVILGARTLEQLEDNLAAAEIRLEPGEMARLDEVSAVPVGDYPYGRRGVAQRRRNVEG